MAVLIVSFSLPDGEIDPHAALVQQRLLAKGEGVELFDILSLDDEHMLWFESKNNKSSSQLLLNNIPTNLDDYDCIWVRRVAGIPANLPQGDEITWLYQRKTFPTFFRDALNVAQTRVVNRPEYYTVAESKINQLAMASKLGLNIPPTLITNRPHLILHFLEEMGKCVIKSLSQTVTSPTQEVFFMTQVVTSDWVEEHRVAVAMAPAIFQKFIEKICEYRVTVFGKRMFVTKIEAESQVSEDYLDWRNYLTSTKWTSAHLPKNMERKLFAFMHNFKLEFATFDLIYGQDGKIYFLECNPNGQWLFIEELTKQPLIEEFCNFLAPIGAASRT